LLSQDEINRLAEIDKALASFKDQPTLLSERAGNNVPNHWMERPGLFDEETELAKQMQVFKLSENYV